MWFHKIVTQTIKIRLFKTKKKSWWTKVSKPQPLVALNITKKSKLITGQSISLVGISGSAIYDAKLTVKRVNRNRNWVNLIKIFNLHWGQRCRNQSTHWIDRRVEIFKWKKVYGLRLDEKK